MSKSANKKVNKTNNDNDKKIKEKYIDNLCFLPVYIDKTKLLDINSILFDGYSEFSEVNCTNEDKNSTSQKGKANAGIGMSIFSLGSQLESDSSNNKNLISNISLKRVQTSSSLLANTIKLLSKNQMLKHIPLRTGQLIEVKGEFKNNSLIDCLDQLLNIANFAQLATKFAKKNTDQTDYNSMKKEIKKIQEILSSNLKNKSELVYETNECIYVAKIDPNCLYNCGLYDIYNNELNFFGQIKGIYKNYKFFS